MSFRLSSLRFTGRGETPLGSAELEFGQFLTWICGPNGSGKTPVMRGLIRALGFPAPVAPDIQHHTEGVRLAFASGKHTCRTFARSTEALSLHVECDGVDGKLDAAHLQNEKEASAWVMPKMGIEPRSLKGKRGGEIPPYASVVFPAFWVDQDTGWNRAYSSSMLFVQDQREEVIRWMLGLRAKNAPEIEREYEAAKKRLKSVGASFTSERELAKTLRATAPSKDVRELETLTTRREHLARELENMKSAFDNLGDAFSGIDGELHQLTNEVRVEDRRLAAIDARAERVAATAKEIDAQINIVGSNEVAAGAFRVLCGNEACQFFRTPEESFGRRLLYLKDQLKDLGVASGVLAEERQVVLTERTLISNELESLRAERRRLAAAPAFRKTTEAIESLATRLAEMDVRIARAEQLRRCNGRVAELGVKRAAAADEVADLKPTGTRRADVKALDARKMLADSMQTWLGILNTKNIRGATLFDERFRLLIGDELFTETSSYSGSTRTRIVLAYHAALLEVALEMDGEHPPLLLLDAPKQQELHIEDLWAYVEGLRALAARRGGLQLVMTSTDEPGELRDGDVVWRPAYSGGAYFLG